MSRYGMTVDIDRCVGCRACSVACTLHNGLPKDMRWSSVLEQESGVFPAVDVSYLPLLCMHCENAPCVEVCPTGASFKTDEGVVLTDPEICIGCGSCVTACPYGARTILSEVTSNHGAEGPVAHEELAFGNHKANVAEKCTFCYGRVENDSEPICVTTCPAHARRFGDLDDESSEVAQLAASADAKQLLESEGTKPSVYYLSKKGVDIDGIFKA